MGQGLFDHFPKMFNLQINGSVSTCDSFSQCNPFCSTTVSLPLITTTGNKISDYYKLYANADLDNIESYS